MAPRKSLLGPTLKALTVKYQELQAALNDIFKFADKFKAETTASQVSVRLESLNKLWDVLCTTLVEIKSHKDYNPEDDPTYKKDRETLTEGYYRVKSLLLDKLKERQEVPCEPTHNDTIVGGTDHARLPQIKLPMFKGNIDEWLSFRDLFLSLIHWKSDLPDVEKFHYLKNCLDDNPKRIISGLSTTSVNYKLAWDRLQRYYNNHKVLKQRLVQSLFTLPTLAEESATDLHSLVDEFERVLNTLDQVVSPVDYKDLLLVNLLVTRLDPVTRRAWEEVSTAKDLVRDSLGDFADDSMFIVYSSIM